MHTLRTAASIAWLALLAASGWAQAGSDPGDAVVVFSDPTVGAPSPDDGMTGRLAFTIECKRADGTVEKISGSITITQAEIANMTVNANIKRNRVLNKINALAPNCFSAMGSVSGSDLIFDAEPGSEMTKVEFTKDTTGQDVSTKLVGGTAPEKKVTGKATSRGTGSGGVVSLSVGSASASVASAGKPSDQIMAELASQLAMQGIALALDGNVLLLTDDLSGVTVTLGTTDPTLAMGLDVQQITFVPSLPIWAVAILLLLGASGGAILLSRRT